MKYLLLLCTALLFLGTQTASAQTPKSTYLYLEISKNLPVKIKLNDRSIRNEQKGYIIIPRMNEGKNTLEFNFSNPNFKTHKFEIESNGKRSVGLKLMRVSNNKFILQDVVNRRIISDVTTLSSSPILASKKITKPAPPLREKSISKKEQPTRGVVKVYEAERTVTTSPVKKKSTPKKIETAKVKKAQAASSEPKVYAMYKYRQPMTDAKRRNRYKDYGKAKRAKRKAAKGSVNPQATINKKANTQAALREKEVRRKQLLAKEKAAYLKRQEATKRVTLDKNKLKEGKRLKKEARRKAQLAKEKAEADRIARERAELKKIRAKKSEAKKRIAQEKRERKEADIRATKRAKLAKKKSTKKSSPAIGEKVINAEPISGQPANAKKKNYESPNEMRAIRCSSTVRSEKAAGWTLKLHKKFDDEARMNYIRRKMGSQCISTNNLGVILGNMDTQIGRYKMIRSVYNQIEDPANIDRLYKYFKSKSYISKLKELKPSSF